MKPGSGLSLKEIRYTPEGRLILKGISLEVSPGEFVGILGPNGAGKSTLLRIVAAVLPASEGMVFLDGQVLSGWSARERSQRLAYIPQHTGVPFPFRAYEVVLMGRTPHLRRWQKEGGEDFRLVNEAMALTDIAHLAERDITTLSGGEMQRVALARALAQKPAFLLLDEPTASLDLRHQIEILDVLAEMAGRGITVLTALHDLNLAAAYCSAVVLLREGEVYAAGPPRAVLTSETLRAVFGVEVFLGTNPMTGALYIVPLQTKAGTEKTSG